MVIENNMKIKDAQLKMRRQYLGGGPGAFVSGVVWIIAGIIGLNISIQASVMTLFFGGMIIHPLGTLIAKLLGGSNDQNSQNPLTILALESTVLLFIGLFIAFSVVQVTPAWFFPIMLLVIGGRYLIFSTIYGMRIYWILGCILAIVGGLLLFFSESFTLGAFLGGSIEVLFSFIIVVFTRRQENTLTT